MQLDINYLAVVAAAVWGFVLGGIWYSPKVFGERWAEHVGLAGNPPPTAQAMRAMALFVVGMFFISFVLAHNMAAWTPATWLAGGAQANWARGLEAGFWTWLGFIFPVQLGVTVFEMKRPGYLLINTSFYLLALLGMGLILAIWP